MPKMTASARQAETVPPIDVMQGQDEVSALDKGYVDEAGRVQREMHAIGLTLYELAWRLFRLGTAIEKTTSYQPELACEVADAAVLCAGELACRADLLVEESCTTYTTLCGAWRAKRSGAAWNPARPAVAIPITPVTTFYADVKDVRETLFDVGLQVHRTARQLYFLARNIEIPFEGLDILEAEDGDPEPRPEHVGWHVAESCNAAHSELWQTANRLIAGSKATSVSSGCQWEPDYVDEDENRILG